MNQHGGSLTDTLVKLVLIFFISLLSFSVGTFVGKQFADGQRKYTSLEADYNSQRETASVAADGEHVKSDEALTDEDIANLTEEFVKSEKEKGKDIMKHEGSDHGQASAHEDEHGRSVKVVGKGSKSAPAKGHEESGASAGHGDSHGSAGAHGAVAASGKADAHAKAGSHGKADAHGAGHGAASAEHGSGHHASGKAEAAKGDGHGPAEVQQAAQRVAHGETPVKAVVAEKRAPSSLPPVVSASTAGKFTVQIAAYATENEAQKRVAGLKEKGFSAFTVSAQKNGKNFYRVSVGLYSSQKDAASARETLAKQAELKDAFVQKIVE